MNKVVWGMTSQHDYETADDFTEFRGCVITSPTESWRCDFCDAKIIPSHTPQSGVCLEEAPRQLNQALEIFASRINQIADNHYHPDSERRSPVASLVCNGEDYFSSPSFLSHLPHLTDEQMLGMQIPEPFNEHESKGDYLSVTVCPNLELRFFFEGTGELVTQIAASMLKPGTPRDLYDFASPEFSSIETQIEDLVTGHKLPLPAASFRARFASARFFHSTPSTDGCLPHYSAGLRRRCATPHACVLWPDRLLEPVAGHRGGRACPLAPVSGVLGLLEWCLLALVSGKEAEADRVPRVLLGSLEPWQPCLAEDRLTLLSAHIQRSTVCETGFASAVDFR
jgi:hypothetical protein